MTDNGRFTPKDAAGFKAPGQEANGEGRYTLGTLIGETVAYMRRPSEERNGAAQNGEGRYTLGTLIGETVAYMRQSPEERDQQLASRRTRRPGK